MERMRFCKYAGASMSSDNTNGACCLFCSDLPIRARVAFALATAQHVVTALHGNQNASHFIHSALVDGWRWEQGHDIRAITLYELHTENLAVQSSLINEKRATAAMCAAVSAFYYMLWHAFRQDLSNGMVNAGDVPNDIADVTEDVIQEVCEYALKSRLCDDAWISFFGDKLLNDYRTKNIGSLGSPINPDYFQYPSPPP
jgi:hypothetical protein